MMENKIRVRPIGIDPRTTATLDLAFKGLGKGQLELTEDLKADVVLFDGDAVEAKSRFNQFVQNNAEMPLLVMSVRPENWSSNAQTISKPLDVNSLFKKIKSLLKKNEQASTNPFAKFTQPVRKPFTQQAVASTVEVAQTYAVKTAISAPVTDVKQVPLDQIMAEIEVDDAPTVPTIEVVVDQRVADQSQTVDLLSSPEDVMESGEQGGDAFKMQAQPSVSDAILDRVVTPKIEVTQQAKPEAELGVKVPQNTPIIEVMTAPIPIPDAPELSSEIISAQTTAAVQPSESHIVTASQKGSSSSEDFLGLPPLPDIGALFAMQQGIKQEKSNHRHDLDQDLSAIIAGESAVVAVLPTPSHTEPEQDSQSNPAVAPTTPSLKGEEELMVSKQVDDSDKMCGFASDINMLNPTEFKKLCFDFDLFLCGHLRRGYLAAKAEQKSALFEWQDDIILLSPEEQRCYTSMNDVQLRLLAQTPMPDPLPFRLVIGQSDVFSRAEGDAGLHQNYSLLFYSQTGAFNKTNYENIYSEHLTLMLSRVALWSAHGRLPNGIAASDVVKLRKWPDLTRIMPIPSATRIAALWIQGNYSLASTSEVLRLPQRYIFSFYTVCRMLDLI